LGILASNANLAGWFARMEDRPSLRVTARARVTEMAAAN
jgi:hypothetical protein